VLKERDPGKWIPVFRKRPRSHAIKHAKCKAIVAIAAAGLAAGADQESKMPKMKTKSGAKKRFKVTGSGKVLYQQSRKRHGMIKRTKKQIRQLRGTNVLFKTDGDNIKKYFLPNG
jgi:large subunit ribosomal protein L35